MRMPEEVNRRVTDHVSSLLFCPTRTAVANLRAEGITRDVHLVGDVMLDALHQQRARISRQTLPPGATPRQFHVVTIHRPENVDDPQRLGALVRVLADLDRVTYWPLHPRTRQGLNRIGFRPGGAIVLLPPLPYLAMLRLVRDASVLLTDSGGLQKEAFLLGTPCVTLRNSTEWPETIRACRNAVVGTTPSRIMEAVQRAERLVHRLPRGSAYGDGHAAEKIARILLSRLHVSILERKPLRRPRAVGPGRG